MAKILALLYLTVIIMVSYVNSNQEAGRVLNYGLYEDVAQEVIGVYARASTCLALIKIHSIIVKHKRGYERQVQSRRQSLSESKQKEFDDKLDCLFEVLSCQCPMSKNDDDEEVTIQCGCPLNQKIPKSELRFVYAQRNRKDKAPALQIGRLDVPTTKKLQKNKETKVYVW